MHQTVCNVKMPKMAKSHNSRNTFQNLFKVNQVIYSLLPIYSLNFIVLASIVFKIFCWQDSIHIFSKGRNSGKGHNPDKKKSVSYFFMRNPYMKFQNPSMHSSKLTLSIKKCAMYKCPKWQRAITQAVLFRIYSKVNQVIYSSLPINSLNFKALASIGF